MVTDGSYRRRYRVVPANGCLAPLLMRWSEGRGQLVTQKALLSLS
jgi:hypothetical protein